MRALFRTTAFVLLFFMPVLSGFAQINEGLVVRMQQHENNILLMYLEYQKLYYEDKSRVHELRAFEELLSVYIDQVMEIYETLNLSEKKNREPRDIAARALIFKSLMFLEKAPLNNQYFESACYEYYEALKIYTDTDDPPVIYKDLPQPILAGNKTYYRLKDILEDKGSGLHDFGKVQLSFRNFMVTANFDPENLELIQLPGPNASSRTYTFDLAERRIKDAFSQVFRRVPEVETYVALPGGTYVLRLHGGTKTDYTALTRFYVRANHQHKYIMEPLDDWIVLYENPARQRPDFYRYRRNKSTLAADGFSANIDFESQNGSSENNHGTNGHTSLEKHEVHVSEIVNDLLPTYDIKMMFEFNDPEIKNNAVSIIAKSILEHIKSQRYYNSWSGWTASWEIAQNVREVISPGSLIPIELVELIYKTLKEL